MGEIPARSSSHTRGRVRRYLAARDKSLVCRMWLSPFHGLADPKERSRALAARRRGKGGDATNSALRYCARLVWTTKNDGEGRREGGRGNGWMERKKGPAGAREGHTHTDGIFITETGCRSAWADKHLAGSECEETTWVVGSRSLLRASKITGSLRRAGRAPLSRLLFGWRIDRF